MLNSNMQCSHHGNGGSSEASHGAKNVCFFVCVFACKSLSLCVCESMRLLCIFLQRCGTICRASPSGGAVRRGEGVRHSSGCKKRRRLRRSLEGRIPFSALKHYTRSILSTAVCTACTVSQQHLNQSVHLFFDLQ